MEIELTLPVANGVSFELRRSPAEEWVPGVIWEAALVINGLVQPLGGATIDECTRGLLQILKRRDLTYFPEGHGLPEHVGVMSFYDETGPRTRIFVLRTANGQFELAWQEREGLKLHRTGTIPEDEFLQAWPALLESGTGPRDGPLAR